MLIELAATNGKLRRTFIWGSFVTAKLAPKDLDILLIMDEDFEVDGIAGPARAVFNSVWARLLFESDVFWARSSIGPEVQQRDQEILEYLSRDLEQPVAS